MPLQKRLHHEDEYEEWESSSGGTWSSYVRNYVNVKDKSPEYYKVDKIGTLTIRGFDKNFESCKLMRHTDIAPHSIPDTQPCKNQCHCSF